MICAQCCKHRIICEIQRTWGHSEPGKQMYSQAGSRDKAGPAPASLQENPTAGSAHREVVLLVLLSRMSYLAPPGLSELGMLSQHPGSCRI